MNNPRPAYPLLAIRQGAQGQVLLLVEVLTDGRAGRIELEKSSGHAALDAAAINAVGQVDPVAIQRDLVAAHAALRDALDDPGRGFANARTVVESFARQAATWRASLPTSNTP